MQKGLTEGKRREKDKLERPLQEVERKRGTTEEKLLPSFSVQGASQQALALDSEFDQHRLSRAGRVSFHQAAKPRTAAG